MEITLSHVCRWDEVMFFFEGEFAGNDAARITTFSEPRSGAGVAGYVEICRFIRT